MFVDEAGGGTVPAKGGAATLDVVRMSGAAAEGTESWFEQRLVTAVATI